MRRLAIVAILLISVGAPIVEMYDRWDHTVQDGNDTESDLVIGALCVGLALSLTGVLLAGIRPASTPSVRRVVSVKTRTAPAWLANPIPNSRPPTALRV